MGGKLKQNLNQHKQNKALCRLKLFVEKFGHSYYKSTNDIYFCVDSFGHWEFIQKAFFPCGIRLIQLLSDLCVKNIFSMKDLFESKRNL